MRKRIRNLYRLIGIITISLCFQVVTAQREVKTINEGWRFHKEEAPGEVSMVNLPHTWNEDAYIIKNYYRGTGIYSRDITFPKMWRDKELFMTFEAASKSAKVFVNDQFVGEHYGGYTAFTLDITPYCSFIKPNTITVYVDNSSEEIPPISGDFTFFGGIYRDVWITAVSKQHFNLLNHGSSSVFINTPQVSEKEASLIISAEIKNEASEKIQLTVDHLVYDPNGKIVQTLQNKIVLDPGSIKTVTATSNPIQDPKLWSPETPDLYRVETILSNAKTKEIIDRINNYTGFRWYRFDGNEGFFLNGKSYKLRGVCRHQDQKPIGVALSDEMHRRDMLLAKEMGANFIRISHYPQDAAILEQCDKLGLLVWEEIPVINIVPESENYANTCEVNLREMIRQHYNHPSIIMWGYMNEILLVTQRQYKGDALKPVYERTLALANRLEKVIDQEDPSRCSVMAFHGSNSYNEVGLGRITDVVGWNLYSGWYGGDLNGFDKFVDNQHLNHPTHPIIVSEYGAGSDKRLHSLNPKRFDFSIEYQQKFLEYYLPVIEKKKFIGGSAHWNFIDFSSALREESMPRINNKGLVYSDRSQKDVFFYFKALWRNDIPVLHIASRDWTMRSGIQNDNKPVIQSVKIYTNIEEVEFYIDGRFLGKEKSDNCSVVFNVPFTEGEHFIRVSGMQNGKLVEDGMQIHFSAVPSKLTNDVLRDLELAVNVGSNCFYTSDESNLSWLPDQLYQSGSWGYLSNELTMEEVTNSQIYLTSDNPLYQTLRSNLKGYRFDVPEGIYEVELLFADIFTDGKNLVYMLDNEGVNGTNGNAFSIYINDKMVEKLFCPVCEVGTCNALKKRYLVEAEHNGVEILFKIVKNKSFLNGIKLRKL